jgi:hypothetical protein
MIYYSIPITYNPEAKDPIIDAASTKIWQTLENPSPTSNSSTVNELNFSTLKYEIQQGTKLGEYEIAHKQSNLEDKWRPAYAILRNSNATIKDRYHGETFQYSYWLYDEDKIYRQKLKTKTQN